MQTQLEEKTHIFNIYLTKNGDVNAPAIEDVADHEIDPLWVAATMYLIYSRYIDSVEESNQIKFEQDVMHNLKHLFDAGQNYIDRL